MNMREISSFSFSYVTTRTVPQVEFWRVIKIRVVLEKGSNTFLVNSVLFMIVAA